MLETNIQQSLANAAAYDDDAASLGTGASNSAHGSPAAAIGGMMEFDTTPQPGTVAAVIDDDGDNTMPFEGEQGDLTADGESMFGSLIIDNWFDRKLAASSNTTW